NRYSMTKGSASWDKDVAKVFGIWLNPVGGLVNDPVNREAMAAALRETMVDGPDHVAERVQTIATFVPPMDEQEARLARLRKMAKTLKALPDDKIPEEARPYLKRWTKAENLEPITLEEVPPTIRKGFMEVDGRTDRVVLLFPSLKVDYNDA